jgi:hypothetical protein
VPEGDLSIRGAGGKANIMADAPQMYPVSFPFMQQTPSIYFNGFSLQLSNSDVSAVLIEDGRPLAKLNLSFTTAKTLLSSLGELIEKLETVTNHNVMVAGEVEEGLKKLVEDQKG